MMEEVVDSTIDILETIRTTYVVPSSASVLGDHYGITAETKFGNPGFVHISEYPFLFVEPVQDEPDLSTVGLAGYDVRTHIIRIGFVIDVSDYFDPTTTELTGLRELTQVMDILNRQFRRFSRLTLGNLSGVRKVTISTTEYKPTIMDDTTFVMVGMITLGVERQYTHEV